MKLYHKGTGQEVKAGDPVMSSRGEVYVVDCSVGRPPHKPGSTGRIHVYRDTGQNTCTFFPSVFDCEWREE